MIAGKSVWPAILRLPEPQSLSEPDDLNLGILTKICAAQRPFQDRSNRHAHKRARNSNLPSAPCTSHQPLSVPDDPNRGIPIKICAVLVRVCPDYSEFPCLALEFLHFHAFWANGIWGGDLARRLIPWTAALLARVSNFAQRSSIETAGTCTPQAGRSGGTYETCGGRHQAI
jgi:hypothetical protein